MGKFVKFFKLYAILNFNMISKVWHTYLLPRQPINHEVRQRVDEFKFYPILWYTSTNSISVDFYISIVSTDDFGVDDE